MAPIPGNDWLEDKDAFAWGVLPSLTPAFIKAVIMLELSALHIHTSALRHGFIKAFHCDHALFVSAIPRTLVSYQNGNKDTMAST